MKTETGRLLDALFLIGGDLVTNGLYLNNWYVNAEYIINLPFPFVFCVGGRGVGKTYGALNTCVKMYSGHFHLMRRTQTELDNIANNINNPFKPLNNDFNYDIQIKPSKNFGLIIKDDAVIGQMIALSTVSNIRGFDSSEIELTIYDEFIPESHKQPIKNEHLAFLNYYETVNRNRELQGKPPLKIRCFSNSNDILNPLIVGLGLVTAYDKMRKRNQDIYIDNMRGMALIDLRNSPISNKKSKTALYKFAGEGEFTNMAIKNDFNSQLSKPVSRPLKEYIPLLCVGEICIYKHKSNGKYYVSSKRMGAPIIYTLKDTDLKYMRLSFDWLVLKYYESKIEFEETITEILFIKYWNIKI